MSKTQKPIVRLTGADGNAFNVIGLCLRAARKADWSQERIDAVRADLTSGDYNHLLCIAMTEFDVR